MTFPYPPFLKYDIENDFKKPIDEFIKNLPVTPVEVKAVNRLIDLAGKLNIEKDKETESQIWKLISEISLKYSQKLSHETT